MDEERLKCMCWENSVYSEPIETCNSCNGTGTLTLDEIETKAFRDGVRYALDYLKDIFGDEVAETNLWEEYNKPE
jgi:hypothetical protein